MDFVSRETDDNAMNMRRKKRQTNIIKKTYSVSADKIGVANFRIRRHKRP